jgi:hypothetical protein
MFCKASLLPRLLSRLLTRPLLFSGGVTAVMWILRYVVFDLQESCKYLVAKGRDKEAIEVSGSISTWTFFNALKYELPGPRAYCSQKWENYNSDPRIPESGC